MRVNCLIPEKYEILYTRDKNGITIKDTAKLLF